MALNVTPQLGSPWDEDKAMMGRWGLEGMASFEQPNVARKEGARLANQAGVSPATAPTDASNEVDTTVV